jgi:hypothetical protein
LLGLLTGSAANAGDRRDIEANGPELNGITLVSPGQSGSLSLLAVDLRDGVLLANGRSESDVTISGSLLQHKSRTTPVDGWVGAQLFGVASNLAKVKLRIERLEIAPDPNPQTAENENQDVYLYQLSYKWVRQEIPGPQAGSLPQSEWTPLCPSGGLAIALAGRWDYHDGQRGDSGRRSSDPHMVTFACHTAAIAKCLEKLGYKPWLKPFRSTPTGREVSAEALHAACVRALRADYCGNGHSLTHPEVPINIYDAVGSKRDVVNWSSEAAWTPDGAVCVHGTRLERNPNDAMQTPAGYIAKHCVNVWSERPCQPPRTPHSAIIWTEYQPRPLP